MIRDYARIERNQMIKLVVVSFIAILLYLAFSFEDVYGYQLAYSGSLMKIRHTGIDWNHDLWLDTIMPSLQMSGADSRNDDFSLYRPNDFSNNNEGEQNKTVPTIPEPVTIMLIGMGVLSLAVLLKLR